MAKGAAAKQAIFEKILETFEGSFMYNNGKELRIPWLEDGNEVQIKVALTCAKDNVDREDGKSSSPVTAPIKNEANFVEPVMNTPTAGPTEEEKANVENLLKALGLG